MENQNYLGSDLTIKELLEIRSHNILRRNIESDLTDILIPYKDKVLKEDDIKVLVSKLCDFGLIKNAQVAFGLLANVTSQLESGIELTSSKDVISEGEKLLDSSINMLTRSK
jgi:hypothetical protein